MRAIELTRDVCVLAALYVICCCTVVAMQLSMPRGLKLLRDGSGVVVSDRNNGRLAMFSLDGKVCTTLDHVSGPYDVVEVDDDGSFIACSYDDGTLVRVSADGTAKDEYTLDGVSDDDEAGMTSPCAIALLPGGGLVVRDGSGHGREHLRVFKSLHLRMAWLDIVYRVVRMFD